MHHIIYNKSFMKTHSLSIPTLKTSRGMPTPPKRTFITSKDSKQESVNKLFQEKITYLPLLTLGNFKKRVLPTRQLLEDCIIKKQTVKSDDEEQSHYINTIRQLENPQRRKSTIIINTFVGNGMTQTFYNSYKQFDKQKKKETIVKHQNKQAVFVLLELLEKYGLPPQKMNMVKQKGESDILYFNNFGLTYRKTKILQEIGNLYNHYSTAVFSSNSLQDIDFILGFTNLEELDLSENHLGSQSVKVFSKYFATPGLSLTKLNLQNNLLGDISGEQLVEQITIYKRLVYLNLSKNSLGLQTAKSLKQLFKSKTHLYELYLHWNEFNEESGRYIFEGLEQNTTLRVLDLSWNYLGGNPKMTNYMKKSFEKVLVLHLDLSFNSFDEDESKILAEGIAKNNSTYGLHFEGNHGFVDQKGFLIVSSIPEDPTHKIKHPLPTNQNYGMKRINGILPNENHYHFRSGRKSKDICWICSSWTEMEFAFEKKIGNKDICVHFNIDNYRPEKLPPDGKVRRMFPKNTEITFFLSYDYNDFYLSKRYRKRDITQPLLNIEMDINTIIPRINLPALNYVESPNHDVHLINQHYKVVVKTLPRLGGIPRKKATNNQDDLSYKTIRPFDFELSPFKEWRQATDDIIDRCIEFDYEHSKIKLLYGKTFKLQEIKKSIRPYYIMLSTVYYHFSLQNRIKNAFSASPITFQSLVAEQLNICSKRFPVELLNISITAALPKIKEDWGDLISKNNNSSAFQPLQRPQFLELIFRIAHQKYTKRPKQYMLEKLKKAQEDLLKKMTPQEKQQALKKQRIYLNFDQAIIKIIKQFQPIYRKIDPTDYRQYKIWSSETCLVILEYESFLKQLYQKYKHSQSRIVIRFPSMYFEDWWAIWKHAKLIKDTEEDKTKLSEIFMASKFLEIEDGVECPKMHYSQFIESLIRVSELLSLPTYYKAQWKAIDWKFIPLAFKIENLIAKLYFANEDLNNKYTTRLLQKHGMFQQEFAQFELMVHEKAITPWQYSNPYQLYPSYKSLNLIVKRMEQKYLKLMAELQKKQKQLEQEEKRYHVI